MSWLRNLDEGTNFLVCKGFTWTEVRKMESWRVRNFVKLNDDIDRAQVDSMKGGSGGGGGDKTLQGSGSRLVSRGGQG